MNQNRGRPLFLQLGNEGVPNRPQSLPRASGNGSIPPFAPILNSGGSGVYQRAQIAPYEFAVDTGGEILAEPPFLRAFMSIRNSRTSVGLLGIGLNSLPSDPDLCSFELAPGETLFMDYFVAQNRIFGYAFNGPVNLIVTYANVG